MPDKPKPAEKLLRTIATLLPIAGAVGYTLPFVTKYIANRMLKRFPGLDGHTGTIHMSFSGSTITISDLFIDMRHRNTNEQVLRISCTQATVKVDRKALRKGIIGGEVTLETPHLSVMRTRMSRRLKYVADLHLQVCISKAIANNGTVEYIDEHAKPPVKVGISSLHIDGTNLSNQSSIDTLPCCIDVKAKAYGGDIEGNVKVGFMEEQPAFDLNMEVKGIDMPQLNSFFRTYAKFDVNKGIMNVYTEIAARDGNFKGYVKPVIKDLDVLGPEDKGALNILWQGLVGTVATVFENAEGELSSKIPIQGSFKNPKINTWYAIVSTIGNAFITALNPSFDFDINIGSVKRQAGK